MINQKKHYKKQQTKSRKLSRGFKKIKISKKLQSLQYNPPHSKTHQNTQKGNEINWQNPQNLEKPKKLDRPKTKTPKT